MKILATLTLLTLVAAKPGGNKTPGCDGVIINGINYEKEVIKDNLYQPGSLSIDFDTNILYYSTATKPYDQHYVGAINLSNKEEYNIPGNRNNWGVTVDQKTHKAYIGGQAGIYDFDYDSKTFKYSNISTRSIVSMFVIRDAVYYVTNLDSMAYVYKNGELNHIPGFRTVGFVLDKEDNLFSSLDKGLYLRLNNSFDEVYLGEYNVYDFVFDKNENLFVVTNNSIYSVGEVIDKHVMITKLYEFEAFELTNPIFDNNGNIIGLVSRNKEESLNAIVKLKSTGKQCV